jgi:hypothetical protein
VSERTEWLLSLKEGDEVATAVRYTHPARYRFARVTKLTPTQIVVGSSRYRKTDGGLVGGDSWDNEAIQEPTDTMRERNREHADRHRLNEAKDGFHKLPIETVRALLSVLAAESQKEATP